MNIKSGRELQVSVLLSLANFVSIKKRPRLPGLVSVVFFQNIFLAFSRLLNDPPSYSGETGDRPPFGSEQELILDLKRIRH